MPVVIPFPTDSAGRLCRATEPELTGTAEAGLQTRQEPSDLSEAQSSAQALWISGLQYLRQHCNQPTYETWLKTLQPRLWHNGQFTLAASSEFNRNYIHRHFRPLLSQALATVAGQTVTIDLVVDSDPANYQSWTDEDETATSAAVTPPHSLKALPHPADPLPATPHATAPSLRGAQAHLNPRYTFDAFVVGEHNRFAHAAALAIARQPAQQYNPFFIYGNSGLGKTHLMQAIGHYLHRHRPELHVLYITAEEFTNGLIRSLGSKSTQQFRDRYRKVDVLLMDDVQFLEGKERTQEELFHTFNSLHQSGRQIVLTSDRPPRELTGLEQRLRSRFEWGLMADMMPPDLETRLAILWNKVEREGLQQNAPLDNAVLQRVAELFPNNVRELEGALNRLVAMMVFTGQHISANEVAQLLGVQQPDNPGPSASPVTATAILSAVASYYHVTVSDLTGPCRQREVVVARQVAMYLLRHLVNASFPKIGEWLGNRRHNSILYGVEKVREQLAHQPVLARQLEEIQLRLGQPL